jgi:hypothetical protein
VSVTLSSSLPKDDRNGIGAISAALANDPGAMQIVVAVVRAKTITIDVDSGDNIPTARIISIEAFEGHTAVGKQLREIVRQQYVHRTGNAELPFKKPDIQSAGG